MGRFRIGRSFQTPRLKIVEIAKDVFAALTPYKGFGWSNAGFISRGKGLAYDTFEDLYHTEEMRQIYEQVAGRRLPSLLVCSHFNLDHVWGNKLYKDATVIMHKNALWEHKSEDPQWWDNVLRVGLTKDATPGQKYLAEEMRGFNLDGVEWVDPDITVEDSFDINLDGMKVEIINLAPAHSNSDLILWLPEEKVMMVGDMVFNGVVAHSLDGLVLWKEALDKLIALQPNIVVPGHGPLCGVEFIKEQKAYFEMLFSEFNKHFTDDIGLMELTKKFDISDFLHWLEPERLILNVNTLYKAKKNLQTPVDWGVYAGWMVELKAYMQQKYGDKLVPYDPYIVWDI